MEWGAVIAGLVTIAGLLVKAWLTAAPERQKEAENEEIQQTKNDSMGDNDAVTLKLDGVLDDEANSGGNAGSKGSVLESGSDDTVRRLAGFGIRNG